MFSKVQAGKEVSQLKQADDEVINSKSLLKSES